MEIAGRTHGGIALVRFSHLGGLRVTLKTIEAEHAEAIATATTFSRSIVAQAAALLAEAGVADPGRYLSGLVHTTVDQALVDHTAV